MTKFILACTRAQWLPIPYPMAHDMLVEKVYTLLEDIRKIVTLESHLIKLQEKITHTGLHLIWGGVEGNFQKKERVDVIHMTTGSAYSGIPRRFIPETFTTHLVSSCVVLCKTHTHNRLKHTEIHLN